MPAIAICTVGGEHAPLYLYAGDTEVPVLATQGPEGYELTNRYADGIIGVSAYDAAEAAVDESPFCSVHLCAIERWQH